MYSPRVTGSSTVSPSSVVFNLASGPQPLTPAVCAAFERAHLAHARAKNTRICCIMQRDEAEA